MLYPDLAFGRSGIGSQFWASKEHELFEFARENACLPRHYQLCCSDAAPKPHSHAVCVGKSASSRRVIRSSQRVRGADPITQDVAPGCSHAIHRSACIWEKLPNSCVFSLLRCRMSSTFAKAIEALRPTPLTVSTDNALTTCQGNSSTGRMSWSNVLRM